MIHLDRERIKMNAIRETESICPECLNVLPATLLVEDSKVYMKKTLSRPRGVQRSGLGRLP